MNRFQAYFRDVETSASFLSLYFSQPNYEWKSCAICPCKSLCNAKPDSYCEEIIMEWLEGDSENGRYH